MKIIVSAEDTIYTLPDENTLLAAVEDQMFGLGNPGFCLACGHEQDGCEPDARRYLCESCGEHQVYGAAEILLMTGLGV